jgi:predicted N-acyltransferase
MLGIHTARSIHRLDQQAWDAIAANELLLSHRWQRVMESSRDNYRPRYVLVEDTSGPLAIAVLQAGDDDASGAPWWHRLTQRMTLIIAAPFSARAPGYAIRQDAKPSTALDAIESAAAKLSRRPLLAVGNVSAAEVDVLCSRGYAAIPRPATLQLDLTAAAYAEYLTRLPKQDRQELRRARRRAEEQGLILSHSLIAPSAASLYPLLEEVSGRHNTRPAFTQDVFAALAREMPSETLSFTAFIGGAPAGFVVCVRSGESLTAILIGLHYLLARPACVYTVLLDEIVQWSLRNGIHHIHAGLGNEVQKRRHGFKSRPRWTCLRGPARIFYEPVLAAANVLRPITA